MADQRLDKAGEYKVVFDGVGTAAHAPARSWSVSTSAVIATIIGANAGDTQDTRPRLTAYGNIRGGLITWLQ